MVINQMECLKKLSEKIKNVNRIIALNRKSIWFQVVMVSITLIDRKQNESEIRMHLNRRISSFVSFRRR